MKIVIAGGTGQVGQILTRAFVADGHDIVVLTRRPRETFAVQEVRWDAKNLGAWVQEVEFSDVVINLAGRSVDCRYNAKNRRLIMDSRVDSTRAIGRAIANAGHPPKVWLQASTATIYSHRYDKPNDELTGIIGGQEQDAPETWRFSIDVAGAWENAANEFKLPATRTVLLRSAMTMSPDRGGIFDVLLGLVRKGLGGTCGSGRQFVSWIHEYDFVAAVKWLIEHDIAGPVNLTSPQPLPNADFMRELRKAWGMPSGLPATRWMLEVGALFLRTETELILKSRRVVPARLLSSGFEFRYPSWPEAAAELCSRWRKSH
jgi:uncharacterized protein (TIGR01777 family)